MKNSISFDMTVKELLDQHPYLLHSFIDMGLMCVGCAADTFHTIEDVAREYDLDQNQLIKRLQSAIDHAVATGKTNH